MFIIPVSYVVINYFTPVLDLRIECINMGRPKILRPWTGHDVVGPQLPQIQWLAGGDPLGRESRIPHTSCCSIGTS